nr:unnamed protein product [Spirometra erinaceieuropaei]
MEAFYGSWKLESSDDVGVLARRMGAEIPKEKLAQMSDSSLAFSPGVAADQYNMQVRMGPMTRDTTFKLAEGIPMQMRRLSLTAPAPILQNCPRVIRENIEDAEARRQDIDLDGEVELRDEVIELVEEECEGGERDNIEAEEEEKEDEEEEDEEEEEEEEEEEWERECGRRGASLLSLQTDSLACHRTCPHLAAEHTVGIVGNEGQISYENGKA